MKLTQKEIDDRKRDLRYKHQKQALAECIAALTAIKEASEGTITWCKEHNVKISTTATSNLEAANNALKAVEQSKQSFLRELMMERPAGRIDDY